LARARGTCVMAKGRPDRRDWYCKVGERTDVRKGEI
jgi:hypothetical protein